MSTPRTLAELTVADYGKKITLIHGKTMITGQLQNIEPVMTYDTVLCEDPEKAEGIITGYELTIGGWSSPIIRPNEPIEVTP